MKQTNAEKAYKKAFDEARKARKRYGTKSIQYQLLWEAAVKAYEGVRKERGR